MDNISLYKYIGQEIIFGIYKLSEISDLFRTTGVTINYPGKGKGLPKNKFENYHAHLSINQDSFLKLLNESFKSHLILGTFALCK